MVKSGLAQADGGSMRLDFWAQNVLISRQSWHNWMVSWRIRLVAKDAALSRRRSRVRLPYAPPTYQIVLGRNPACVAFLTTSGAAFGIGPQNVAARAVKPLRFHWPTLWAPRAGLFTLRLSGSTADSDARLNKLPGPTDLLTGSCYLHFRAPRLC